MHVCNKDKLFWNVQQTCSVGKIQGGDIAHLDCGKLRTRAKKWHTEEQLVHQYIWWSFMPTLFDLLLDNTIFHFRQCQLIETQLLRFQSALAYSTTSTYCPSVKPQHTHSNF